MIRHVLIILVGLAVGSLYEWRLGLELIGADLCLQIGYTRCWRRFASARPVSV
jgi:hypothetical protein